jgi:hypothetical protein
MSVFRLRSGWVILLVLAGVAAIPAVARASDTFADASQPNDNGNCLTPATACKTIAGALAKASAGFAVHIGPGTYAENVTLNTGVSLVADSGNPVIEPAGGPAVSVTGGAAPHITGLTFASSASGPEVVLGDAAGNAIVADDSFIDRTPGDANQVAGITTTSTGAPKIANNSFTLLQDAVEVNSPAAGSPGRPEITANTISAIPDFGTGVTISSAESAGVTAATAATLTGNLIEEAGDQTNGVLVLDGGAIVGDPSIPGAGVTMMSNRILGPGNGLFDFGARAPVSLFGDVIAGTGSLSSAGRSAITAIANAGLGGPLAVTNVDLLDTGPAIQLSGIDLALDSSIVTGSISQNPNVPSNCAITFSAGPTTSGNSCESFQTNAVPSFFDPQSPATSDFHLKPTLDQAFIDHGNPAAPPMGAGDFDGDPRALDGACPIGGAIRDIGADEFKPGTLNCAAPAAASGGGSAGASAVPTGLRAAALRRCKHKHGQARTRCTRKARGLPR